MNDTNKILQKSLEKQPLHKKLLLGQTQSKITAKLNYAAALLQIQEDPVNILRFQVAKQFYVAATNLRINIANKYMKLTNQNKSRKSAAKISGRKASSPLKLRLSVLPPPQPPKASSSDAVDINSAQPTG